MELKLKVSTQDLPEIVEEIEFESEEIKYLFVSSTSKRLEDWVLAQFPTLNFKKFNGYSLIQGDGEVCEKFENRLQALNRSSWEGNHATMICCVSCTVAAIKKGLGCG